MARCAAMPNTTRQSSRRGRRRERRRSLSVPRLLGAGYIAFTVDQGEDTDRYQGDRRACRARPWPNARSTISGNRSRSRPGSSWRSARPGRADAWRAGGLMLQRVPPEGGYGVIADDVEDGWRRAMVLMSSATSDELVDPESDAAPPAVPAVSRGWGAGLRHPSARSALPLLARADRDHPARLSGRRDSTTWPKERVTTVTCEFCSRRYTFDADEISRLAPA